MDDLENEYSTQQSAYPDIHPATPGAGHFGSPIQPQYATNSSREGSAATSEISSDEGVGESPRRKRRRLFETTDLEYDDPEFQSSEEHSPSEMEALEDDDDGVVDGNLDEMGNLLVRRRKHGVLGRPSSTFGARGGKGVKRGPRKPVEPSPEFKQLQSEATLAFIDSDYDRAVTLVKQAIHHNPEIFAAHSLLSEIFLAQGLKAKALGALFSGAHTRPKDPDVWMKVAKLIEERGDDDELSLRDMVYCYSRVVEIDQKNYEARFRRAATYRKLGRHNGRAAQEYERLLKDLPHNTTALRHLAETSIDLNDVDKALERYEESVLYYTSLSPEVASDFSWSDVNVYTDLYAYRKEYKKGLLSIRSLARWLLGRGDDTEWDIVQDDDREWDAEHSPRRTITPGFREEQYPLDTYGYGLPLELRIKLGLFRLRLGPEYKDEALYHFEWLDPDDASSGGKLSDYGDLFRDAADALKDADLHQDALRFYAPLQYSEYADTSLYVAMADCHTACKNDEETERCYLTVAEYDRQNIEVRVKLARFYEKIGLVDQAMRYVTEVAELGQAESMPQRRRRFGRRTEQLAREFRSAESQGHAQDNQDGGQATLGPPVTAPISFTRAVAADIPRDTELEVGTDNRKQDADNVHYLYSKMLELQPAMRSGEEEATEDWLDIADALLRDFRSNRVFFPMRRQMVFLGYSREAQRKAGRVRTRTLMDEVQDIADRLQTVLGNVPEADPESIPTNYHAISFDEWLDVFLEYALVLAGQGQAEEAYDTLGAAADASIWYHSKQNTYQIHVCWFACAIRLKDEETLMSVARWFMKEYQFVTDVYRLFAALSWLGGDPRKSLFHSSSSIKFVLRQVKAVDFTLPPDPTATTSLPPLVGPETASLHTKDESGKFIPAEELDAALLILYGHILYTGTSFTNALNYLFRAYALDPGSPLVLLSIGLCYVHHALKRQAENRHYMIMQGLSFMQEYRRIREQSSVLQERQEMEFNFARVYHMLGLSHLAVRGYEKCLSLGDEIEAEAEKRKQNEDNSGGGGVWTENFSREAAYALQCLYTFSGELEMAKQVTERWLVI